MGEVVEVVPEFNGERFTAVLIDCHTVDSTVVHVQSSATGALGVIARRTNEIIRTGGEQSRSVEIVISSTVEVHVPGIHHDHFVGQAGGDSTIVTVFCHGSTGPVIKCSGSRG